MKTKFKFFAVSVFSLAALLAFAPSASAKIDYLYRVWVNWVKLDDANPKLVPVGSLKHPSSVSADQIEAMLLSIKINRKYLLAKDVESIDVFNSYEARKMAAYFAEGLSKASPDQVVDFSLVHKRPTFILRRDYITMGKIFVTDDGVHFQFSKIFAAISGDYQASAQTDKIIRDAKTRRLSLAAGPGQKLSYDSPMEIILDPNYNFSGQYQVNQAELKEQEQTEMKGVASDNKVEEKSDKKKVAPSPVIAAPRQAAPASQDPSARLKKLDDLKKQGLINDKEYQDLRKKILSEL